MSVNSIRIKTTRAWPDWLVAGGLAAASAFGLAVYGPHFALFVLAVFFLALVMKDLRYGVLLYPLFYLFNPYRVPFIGSPPKLLSLLLLLCFSARWAMGEREKGPASGDRALGLLFIAFLYAGIVSAAHGHLALKYGFVALRSLFLKGLLAYMVLRVVSTRRDLYACFNFYFAMQAALIAMACFLIFYYRQPYIMRMYLNNPHGQPINTWAGKFPFLNATLIQFPNITARAMLVGLPFLAFFARTSRGKRRTAYLALFILSCAAVFVTYSRSGVLALGLLLLLVALRFKSRKMAALLLISAALGGLLVVNNADFDGRFHDLTSGQYHKELRYDIMIASWETFKQHPVLGTGPGSQESEISRRLGLDSGHSGHNFFMNVLMEYGIVGMIFFVALLGVLIKGLFSVERFLPRDEEGVLLARAFQVMFITFLFASQFAPTLKDNHLWYFAGLALAFRKTAIAEDLRQTAQPRRPMRYE